jgi:hypothetical protein
MLNVTDAEGYKKPLKLIVMRNVVRLSDILLEIVASVI